MRSLLVITNTDAGTSDEERLAVALAILREDASVEVTKTSNPGELDGVLHRAGGRTVVVAGGDGSMHAVVKALHKRHELAEATLALANVIYVVGLPGGALVLPLDRYPGALSSVVALLPTAALGEGLRAYAVGALPGWPLLSLSIWCAIGLLAAWKGFRWTS